MSLKEFAYLDLQVGVDGRKLEKLEKDSIKRLGLIRKGWEATKTATKKVITTQIALNAEMRSADTALKELLDAEQRMVRLKEKEKDITEETKDAYEKEVQIIQDIIDRQQSVVSSGMGQLVKEERALLDKFADDSKKTMGKLKEDLGFDEGELDSLKTSIESAFEVGGSLLRKDVEGAIKSGTKSLAKGWKAAFGMTSAGVSYQGKKFFQKGGEHLAKGMAKMREGGLKNKLVGGVQAAHGLGMETFGKALRGLGPMLNMIGKLGPVIGMMGSAVAALVKMFIDAEGMVKDFNKKILEGGSTIGYFADAGRDAEEAIDNLEGTLSALRATAFNLKNNFEWGIGKEQVTAAVSTFQKEGVALNNLEKDMKHVGKTWDEIIKTTVVYSRNLGVSIEEVASLQSEMMSEFGAGVQSVQADLALMARGAGDSGIAANKFFGIIRNMTADMSLFNFRMEDAVNVLKAVGKVMSPRNAQKFMQSLMGLYKGMGLEERVKAVMMGGVEATKKRLLDDLKGKMDGLQFDVEAKLGKGFGKEFRDIFEASGKDGGKALTKFMAEHAKDLTPGLREAIMSAQRQKGDLDKGDAVSVASALQNAGMFAVKKQIDAISQKFTGQKAGDAGGLNRLVVTKLTGLSEEQLTQMKLFDQGLEQARADLVYNLRNNGEKTQEQLATLEKLKAKGIISADQIEKLDPEQFYNAMSVDQQKALEQLTEDANYAKKQTEKIISINDQIEMLVDFFMNEYYNVVMGIWEMIAKSWLGNEDQRQQVAMSREMQKVTDKDLKKSMRGAMKSSQGNAYGYRTDLMNGQAGQKISEALRAKPTTGEGQQAQSGLRQGLLLELSTKEVEKVAKAAGLDNASTEAVKQLAEELRQQATTSGFEVMSAKETGDPNKVLEAERNRTAMLNEMEKKFKEQLTSNELASLLEKVGHFTDPSRLTERIGGWTDLAGKTLGKTEKQGQAPGQSPTTSQKPAAGATTTAPTQPQVITSPEVVITSSSSAPQGQPALGAAQQAVAEVKTGAQDSGVSAIINETAKIQTPLQNLNTSLLESNQHLAVMADSIDKSGVRLDRAHTKTVLATLKGDLTKIIEEGSLEAIRQGLFEYYMYKDIKVDDMVGAMQQSGFDPKTFGSGIAKDLQVAGATQKGVMEARGIKGFANGGVVRPAAPDSLFAAVQPGETIVPKGGAGGGVNLNFNISGGTPHEFADHMRAAVNKGIEAWHRKQQKA